MLPAIRWVINPAPAVLVFDQTGTAYNNSEILYRLLSFRFLLSLKQSKLNVHWYLHCEVET